MTHHWSFTCSDALAVIETGGWQFLMFDSSCTTPLVSGGNISLGSPRRVWSLRVVTLVTICIFHNFQFYLAHLWTDFQSCFVNNKKYKFSSHTHTVNNARIAPFLQFIQAIITAGVLCTFLSFLFWEKKNCAIRKVAWQLVRTCCLCRAARPGSHNASPPGDITQNIILELSFELQSWILLLESPFSLVRPFDGNLNCIMASFTLHTFKNSCKKLRIRNQASIDPIPPQKMFEIK